MGGELGDLVAEPIELRGGMLRGKRSWRRDLHRSLLVLRRLYTLIFELPGSVRDA